MKINKVCISLVNGLCPGVTKYQINLSAAAVSWGEEIKSSGICSRSVKQSKTAKGNTVFRIVASLMFHWPMLVCWPHLTHSVSGVFTSFYPLKLKLSATSRAPVAPGSRVARIWGFSLPTLDGHLPCSQPVPTT